MKKLLFVVRHPIEHATRYVARRPSLKQRLRPLFARIPFLYRWIVEIRTRQVRADFLKAWMKQDKPQIPIGCQGGFYLSQTPVRTTDEILQMIRQELGQTKVDPQADEAG